MGGSEATTVRLFCPLLAKTVPFVVWEEQRLDLGYIAWTFGLDPATLKLNSHFIGRGVDLIASSVTWNSLLSFFSARGFPTGKDDQDALVVDGKLVKVGTKQYEVDGSNRRPQPGDLNLVKNKRLKDISSGGKDLHGIGFKRKQLFEDVRLLKKLNISETYSDIEERGNYVPNAITHTEFACSYMSENLKRRREDEAFLASPCKRIR
ncbi:hypothetical protein I3843_03G143300 [Carya illinoinensis]|uniref:Uncharacterized protein n=1 Tax=Carya illinoinensis TaxID=32201 RepID=A0A8T1R4I2_CARIL|nr:uncharacterized protein LOC122303680 isoform X2 [Carya illinoinensis]KAG2716734.1 hypothetical protein I3760_03G141800 [Carya illinoinensis]KAG6661042.1 hypothetical protein CIPAW_03G147600 [Carya illinoinensis]KAG7987617.1 hypothetical protein I3843_03G143300 [Carya illinoinensis]